MDLEATVKAIRKVHSILSSKEDAEFFLTNKGTSHGVSKPWRASIGSHETNSADHMEATTELLSKLKQELADRIKFAEKQVTDHKKILNSLDN